MKHGTEEVRVLYTPKPFKIVYYAANPRAGVSFSGDVRTLYLTFPDDVRKPDARPLA